MKQFNPFSLVDKQILVTGASSGIGKAIAIACSKMGATVFITGRNVERLNETLGQMSDGNHKVISADLTKAEDIERLVNELPKLDGLVQCVGVGSRVLCKQISQTDIDYVMKPNLEAPVLLQTSTLAKK